MITLANPVFAQSLPASSRCVPTETHRKGEGYTICEPRYSLHLPDDWTEFGGEPIAQLHAPALSRLAKMVDLFLPAPDTTRFVFVVVSPSQLSAAAIRQVERQLAEPNIVPNTGHYNVESIHSIPWQILHATSVPRPGTTVRETLLGVRYMGRTYLAGASVAGNSSTTASQIAAVNAILHSIRLR